jgi:hypothetical protein
MILNANATPHREDPSEIERELIFLEEAIKELGNKFLVLNKRLSPVLACVPEDEQVNDIKAEELVPLAMQIRTSRFHVEEILSRMISTHNALRL